MRKKITFRQIEQQLSITVPNGQPDSALGAWYQAVRDKPITEFEIGDLCRACRQEVYLDYVLPVAIECLREDPLAGEVFDGELLAALSGLPTGFWIDRQELVRDLTAIAQAASNTADDDLMSDIRELLARLSGLS